MPPTLDKTGLETKPYFSCQSLKCQQNSALLLSTVQTHTGVAVTLTHWQLPELFASAEQRLK